MSWCRCTSKDCRVAGSWIHPYQLPERIVAQFNVCQFFPCSELEDNVNSISFLQNSCETILSDTNLYSFLHAFQGQETRISYSYNFYRRSLLVVQNLACSLYCCTTNTPYWHEGTLTSWGINCSMVLISGAVLTGSSHLHILAKILCKA